jgi:hypothetical protein
MLSLQKQNKYFSKEILMPNGSRAVVWFELVETNGRLIAKAISVNVVEEKTTDCTPICLPITITKIVYAIIKNIHSNFVAPLISNLDFIISQPTRAPSLA